MANDSIVKGLLNRGKAVRDVEEPLWYKRYGPIFDAAAQLPDIFRESKKQRVAEYAQELLTEQRFDASLSNPVINAFSDGSIYTNKSIDELEAALSVIKNEDIKRFPDQSVDFIEIYDTKLEQLKEYRSLNSQYNHYVSKIPEAEKFLLGMTDDLTKVKWDELTPEKKREIKDKLFEGTQQIAEFSKFMENNKDYFKNNKSFNKNKNDVDISIIGGYNQLLSQINTLDPSGTIINEDEQNMLIKSIRDKRPDEIIQRNETIARIADKRILGYQNEFDTAYEQHTSNAAIMNSPDFKREAFRVDKELNDFKDDLNKKLDRRRIDEEKYSEELISYIKNPDNWSGTLSDGSIIDISQIRTGQVTLEETMLKADADFEKETGSKYSSWMGRRMSWKEKTPAPPSPPAPPEGEKITPKLKEDTIVAPPKEKIIKKDKEITEKPSQAQVVDSGGLDKLLANIDEEIKNRGGKDFRYGTSKETKTKLSKEFGSRFISKLNDLYSSKKRWGADSKNYKSTLDKFRKYYQSKIDAKSKKGKPIMHGLTQEQLQKLAEEMTD